MFKELLTEISNAHLRNTKSHECMVICLNRAVFSNLKVVFTEEHLSQHSCTLALYRVENLEARPPMDFTFPADAAAVVSSIGR